jgi:AraC-like DNA-binding protein
MLFVPLPLFATLVLTFLFARFVLSRDMAIRAHQLFAGLLGLYAMQSMLTTLRWGYGLQEIAAYVALLAPVLPALAYLAYRALAGRQSGLHLWPLAVIVVNWFVYFLAPMSADPLILLTYFGFGGLLLRLYWKGADELSLPSINEAREIVIAMCMTGGALVASGLTDIYLIYDFMRNDGRTAGLVLTFVPTAFILAIGISATFGRSAIHTDVDPEESIELPAPTDLDDDIAERLDALFDRDGLHRNEDLSLRRLSRRLGLSDRQVSNAINRARGKSVSQFVNDARIKEACALLTSTDKTVLEVSLAAGFATKSNFNREFLRVTRTTPTKWRRDEKSNAIEST